MPLLRTLMAVKRPALPWGECLGVMLGVLSWDWLADGRASLCRAAALAATCGGVLYLIRFWHQLKPLPTAKNEQHD